jgi:hypothetical protein
MTKYLAKIENNKVVDVTRFSDEDYNLGIDHCKNLIGDASSNYIVCEKGVCAGYNYDSNSNTIYPFKPFDSWTLDSNFVWQPPVAEPDKESNGVIIWDETNTRWEGFATATSTSPSTYWDPSDSTWKNI